MPNKSSAHANTISSAFRVDKFVVPADALSAFLERAHRIDGMLATQPGCRQNLVLVQAGDAESKVVTIVEWASVQSMLNAKALVQKTYAEEGFDPAAFMQGLGVRVDMGVYAAA